jgi:PIN domain nuclease of toxin-antitoxin system
VVRSVLDASAILALIQGEPGADVVDDALSGAMVSAVNVAEVATRLSDVGMPDEEVRATVRDLRMDIVSFDGALAFGSAALRGATRAKGLSLGDRACLALAVANDAPALTADRSWGELEVGIEIRMIRG